MNRNPEVPGGYDDHQEPPRAEYGNAGDVALRDVIKDSLLAFAKRDVNQPGRDQVFHSHNYFATADPESGTTRRRARMRDHAAVDALAQFTVPPPGLPECYPNLKSDRLLVLACPTLRDTGARYGQNTAAQWLLARLIRDSEVDLDDRSVHKLFLDQDEALLAALEAEVTSTTCFADLVDAEGARLDQVVEELGDVTRRLSESESYLVLSFPLGYKDKLLRAVPGRVHELGLPAGDRVFERHLSGGMPESEIEALAADSDLKGRLAGCKPAEAARLAQQALAFREQHSSIDGVIKGLRNVHRDWAPTLRNELDVNVDAFRRCLLLSAAVLEGVEPGTVVQVAHDLVKATKFDLPRVHPLVEPSAVTQLERLGETLPFDVGTVRFRELGFADAVLPHVWRGYRPLRSSIEQWLIRLPLRPALFSTSDLNRLADAVAQLGVRIGPEVVLRIARAWAMPLKQSAEDSDADRNRRESTDRTRRSLAVRVLTECAVNDRIGVKVRAQLWQWAHHGKDPGLLRTVAMVCGTGFGTEFPRNALTRLRHISLTEDRRVRAEVVSAIRSIAEGIGLPALHRYLLAWLSSERPGDPAVLARAYAGVLGGLDPLLLGRGTGNRPLLTASTRLFWADAYKAMPPGDIAVMVSAWLAVAERTETGFGDAMVELLVKAAGTSLRNAGVLMYALKPEHVPSQDPPTRMDQLKARLYARLDELEAAR